MCFSATLEASVAHLVNDYMRNPVRLAFGSTLKPSENVRVQAFEVAPTEAGNAAPLAFQRNRPLPGVRAHQARRRTAGKESEPRRLCRCHDSWRPLAIPTYRSAHRIPTGTLPGAGRDRLASRGIHVEDIAHVINYDLPEVAENFIHRVGRTGRAGNLA